MWKTANVNGRRYRETQWRDVHLGGRIYTRFRGSKFNEPWTMVTVHHSSHEEHWWARAFC